MKKVFLLSFFVLAFFKFITISVSAQNCQDCGTVNGCKITCCVSSGYDACTASGRTCQNECDPVGCSIPEDCPNKSVAEQCNPLKACSVGKQCNGGQCEYFCVGEAPCAPGGGPTSTPVPPTGGGPTNTPPPPTSTPGPSITPSPIPTITGVCVAPPDPTPRDPPPPDCSAWGGGDTRLRVTNGSSGNEFRFFVSTGNECDPALQVANSGWIANKSYFTNLSTGLYSWDARARCTSDAGNAASGLSACSVFRVDKSPPDVPSLTGSAFCSPSRVTFSWPIVNDPGCLNTRQYWIQGWDSNGTWFINGWIPEGINTCFNTNGYNVCVNTSTDPVSLRVTNANSSFTYNLQVKSGDVENGVIQNQSAWSSVQSVTLPCPTPTPTLTLTPTITLTPTLTPSPTQGPWYKLNSASFNKAPPGNLINRMPQTPQPYDISDDTNQRFLIVKEAGVVTASIADLGSGAPAAKYSTPNWAAVPYLPPLSSFKIQDYINYVKARKKYTTITSLSNIQANNINFIVASSPIAITRSDTDNFPLEPFVLIVQGDVRLLAPTTGLDPYIFNNRTKSFAIITTGQLNIGTNVHEMNGIFIANSVDLCFSCPPTGEQLKIKGNLISQTQIDSTLTKRQHTSGNSYPTLFVSYVRSYYMDLLPYLSVSTYEWKQLQ